MTRKIAPLLLGAVALLMLAAAAAYAEGPCPPGQVMGGAKCEWKELCKAGVRQADGTCAAEPPSRCPDGSNPIDGQCPHVCSDGSMSVNNRCPAPPPPPTCPDGSRLVNGRCSPLPPPPPPPTCPDGRPMINGRCPPVARACESHSVFAASPAADSGRRHLLLVNGDAPALFKRYRNEADVKSVKIDLNGLTVTLYDAAGVHDLVAGENVKMGLGQLLAGMTMEQVWLHALQNLKAISLPDPEGEAKRIGADLVCGPR